METQKKFLAKWSKDNLLLLATKNQKEQPRPNGGRKRKTKHRTPIYSFNEKAKQTALRQTMDT